jgi:hypothetical protein
LRLTEGVSTGHFRRMRKQSSHILTSASQATALALFPPMRSRELFERLGPDLVGSRRHDLRGRDRS